MATEQKSVYKRGADDGLFFGIYLIIMFFSSAFSMAVPFAGLLSIILVLGVPFLIYRFLRRSYVNDSGTTQFSALWVQGITTFFCGSLISGIAALVYMQWVNPDFISFHCLSSKHSFAIPANFAAGCSFISERNILLDALADDGQNFLLCLFSVFGKLKTDGSSVL